MKVGEAFLIVLLLIQISSVYSIIRTCPCDQDFTTCELYCCCDTDCNESIKEYWKSNNQCSFETFNIVCYNNGTMYHISKKKAGIERTYIKDKSDQMCIKVDKQTIQTEAVQITTDEVAKLQRYIDLQQKIPEAVLSSSIDGLEKHYTPYSGFQIRYISNTATGADKNINYNNNLNDFCDTVTGILANSNPMRLCIGETVHVFAKKNTDITIKNEQKSQTPTFIVNNSKSVNKAVLSYLEEGFIKSPIYEIQLNSQNSILTQSISQINIASPQRSRLDLVTENLNNDVWVIENSVPKSPGFFPTLPPDIFYPIWFESQSSAELLQQKNILFLFSACLSILIF